MFTTWVLFLKNALNCCNMLPQILHNLPTWLLIFCVGQNQLPFGNQYILYLSCTCYLMRLISHAQFSHAHLSFDRQAWALTHAPLMMIDGVGRRVNQHGGGVCRRRQLHWAATSTATSLTWLRRRGDHPTDRHHWPRECASLLAGSDTHHLWPWKGLHCHRHPRRISHLPVIRQPLCTSAGSGSSGDYCC